MPWFDKHGKLRARLSAMVDGELSGRQLTELNTHLETCDACTRELHELRAMSTALNSAVEAEPRRSFALTPEMIAGPAKPTPPAPMPRMQVGMRLASAAIALALVVVFVADNSFGGGSSNSDDTTRDSSDESAQTGETELESDAIVEDLASTTDPAYSTIGETPTEPQTGAGLDQGADDGEAAPTTTTAPAPSGEPSTGGGSSSGSGGVGGGGVGGGPVDGGGTVPEVTAAPPIAAPEVTPVVTPLATEQRAVDQPTVTEAPLAIELTGDDDSAEDTNGDASPDPSDGGDSDVNVALILELVLLAALFGTVGGSIFLAVRRNQS